MVWNILEAKTHVEFLLCTVVQLYQSELYLAELNGFEDYKFGNFKVNIA